MANYDCVRIEKVKTEASLKKLCDEHNRKNGYENRSNVNAQLSSSNKIMSNMDGVQYENFKKRFDERKELYKEKKGKKLRKDAVKALDGVLILSKVSDKLKFEKSCVQFLKEFFPEKDLAIWFHNDEKNYHCHFMTPALDKDANCIADPMTKDEVFRRMQTRFAEICQENGLDDVERGISKADRYKQGLPQNYHQSTWKYANKKQIEEEKKKMLQETKEKFQKELNEKFTAKMKELLENATQEEMKKPAFKQKVQKKLYYYLQEEVNKYQNSEEFDKDFNEEVARRIKEMTDNYLDPTQKSSGAKGEEIEFNSNIFEDIMEHII